MKLYRNLILISVGLLLVGCFEDQDDVIIPATTRDINAFIWRGMNSHYLYKEAVPDLADNRFASQQEKDDFLNSFDTPEAFFDALESEVDEFSFLVSDYVRLEQSFDGITRNNGMEIGWIRYPNDPDKVFGFVRYVLPDTNAESQGIKRGMIFNTIDGTQIDDENFRQLSASETYTIGLATFEGTDIIPTNESITLTKIQYTENPVFIAKTLTVEGIKIGYIMYNAFNDLFEPDLNAAFGQLKSEGVSELVLDLRYNGGGNTETAKDLASMITGQFTGEVFSIEEWNTEQQAIRQNSNPDGLVNRFDTKIDNGSAINSLNLNQVYILTTRSSASASELIINGLDPYITVQTVGSTTRGKFQASITMYDSSNFRRARANLGHTYALQPLVLKAINSVGFTDYFDGFAPDIEIAEDFSNAGILGDPEEPLLKAAIEAITSGKSALKSKNPETIFTQIGDSDMFEPNYQQMYRKLE